MVPEKQYERAVCRPKGTNRRKKVRIRLRESPRRLGADRRSAQGKAHIFALARTLASMLKNGTILVGEGLRNAHVRRDKKGLGHRHSSCSFEAHGPVRCEGARLSKSIKQPGDRTAFPCWNCQHATAVQAQG